MIALTSSIFLAFPVTNVMSIFDYVYDARVDARVMKGSCAREKVARRSSNDDEDDDDADDDDDDDDKARERPIRTRTS